MVQMCASIAKEAVIGYLHLLLKGSDLESTTEELLHRKLSDHFQQDMRPFTAEIQACSICISVSGSKQTSHAMCRCLWCRTLCLCVVTSAWTQPHDSPTRELSFL